MSQLFQVSIDFDTASEKWRANKISTGGGTFKYLCGAPDSSSSSSCAMPRMNMQKFCKKHLKLNSARASSSVSSS